MKKSRERRDDEALQQVRRKLASQFIEDNRTDEERASGAYPEHVADEIQLSASAETYLQQLEQLLALRIQTENSST